MGLTHAYIPFVIPISEGRRSAQTVRVRLTAKNQGSRSGSFKEPAHRDRYHLRDLMRILVTLIVILSTVGAPAQLSADHHQHLFHPGETPLAPERMSFRFVHIPRLGQPADHSSRPAAGLFAIGFCP